MTKPEKEKHVIYFDQFLGTIGTKLCKEHLYKKSHIIWQP